ncbi:MAG: hypothetical protein PHU73_01460, partial [Patescibacteria group bacterium]|nr:hypothetical protein [Patescibacteria group bacterium]
MEKPLNLNQGINQNKREQALNARQMLDLLYKKLIAEEGKIINMREAEEAHEVLREFFGGETEYYEMFQNKELMQNLFSDIADNHINEAKKIAALNLLVEISTDLFEESREEESYELLKKLENIGEDPETTIFLRTLICESISRAGRNYFFRESMPVPLQYYISPEEEDSYIESITKDYYEPEDEDLHAKIAPKILGIYSAEDGESLGALDEYRDEVNDLEAILKHPFESKEEQAVLKKLFSLPFRAVLNKFFNIELGDYSPAVQFQLLQFLRTRKNKDFAEIEKFFQNAANPEDARNRILSFLSLEIDKNAGEKILAINRNLEPDDAMKCFSKIAEIINYADGQTDELSDIAEEQKINIFSIRTEMLKKAREIIIKFADELGGEEEKEEKINQLLEDLENSKIKITLLASVLKAAKTEKQQINLKKLEDFNLEIKNNLADAEIKNILIMAQTNWRQIPAMQSTVVEGLEKD